VSKIPVTNASTGSCVLGHTVSTGYKNVAVRITQLPRARRRRDFLDRSDRERGSIRNDIDIDEAIAFDGFPDTDEDWRCEHSRVSA
jgi:hypothetical protein